MRPGARAGARRRDSGGCDSEQELSTKSRGKKRWQVGHSQGTTAIPRGEAMGLWGEAMRLQVIPWGEAIENY